MMNKRTAGLMLTALVCVGTHVFAEKTFIRHIARDVEQNLRDGRSPEQVRKDFLNNPTFNEFMGLSRLEQMKWLANELQLIPSVEKQITWTEAVSFGGTNDALRARLVVAQTYRDFVRRTQLTDLHCRITNINAMIDSYNRLTQQDKANRTDALTKAFYTEHASRLAAYGNEERGALEGSVAEGEREVLKEAHVYQKCKDSGCWHFVPSKEALLQTRIELGIDKGASKPSSLEQAKK